MNKNTYLGLALAVCMSFVSAPLFAEVPEHPANITAPAISATEHQKAATLHKQHAAYHKAMMEHYKALVAAEYENPGHHELKKHYETMAIHHEALSKEHEKAAATHEKIAK